MNPRYRITRAFQEDVLEQTISLEECIRYFDSKPDFTYSQVYTVTGAESTMSIQGDFFMWSYGDSKIPFRHYMGDLYVAISNEAVVPKMIEIASDLHADVTEG